MKPISFPKLTLPDPGSGVAPTLGHPLVDDYLESVHARLRPNSTLAVVYDLKVFFTVIDVDPLEVRRRHVLEFIRVQRTGSTDATVIPIDQSEGLALSTIRRRLSTLAGFYSHLVALGELDHNPVQRGMPVRAPVTRDRRVIPLVRPVRHLPQILDHDDVIKLVAALRKDRDRAMIDAMLLAGLRRCEVLGLRLQDVRWGERRLFIADGKGGHQRIVPISPRFFDTLRRYLDHERPADAETPFVFVVLKGPNRGRPLSREGTRRDHVRRPHAVPGSSMRRVTSCATPVSPGSARPAWPSKRCRPKPVTGRSQRRRSICIWPTIGSPASTYVQLRPLMPKLRSVARSWRHDDAVDRTAALATSTGHASPATPRSSPRRVRTTSRRSP